MIKVTVMYANAPGCKFAHAYYANKHMPLVKRKLGAVHCGPGTGADGAT